MKQTQRILSIAAVAITLNNVLAFECQPGMERQKNYTLEVNLTRKAILSKWNWFIPRPSNLATEITFWCIEPSDDDFQQRFVNEPSNITIPVGFLIHGFTDSIGRATWMNRTAKKWVKEENRAVCLVNWEGFAVTGFHEAAKIYTNVVGAYVAAFIRAQNFDAAKTVVVGHSLGGQVAGYVGAAMSGTLGTIYGLDPAGPFFTNDFIELDPAYRLDPTDALHVQCLHTNLNHFGTAYRCGDSDYFANLGGRQPGCPDEECDHMRAAYIFESSIELKHSFLARDCNSIEEAKTNTCKGQVDRFGIHSKHLKGSFYFITTNCFPYVW